MSPLMLTCGLCGRKQADGLLSRQAWGHVQASDGRSVSACPTCKSQESDWEGRLRGDASGGSAAAGGS